jgi:hypothetical protein
MAPPGAGGIEMMKLCDKCGRPLRRGELTYKVTIDLVSMFDGYIEAAEGDVDDELERLIDAVSRQDPDEVAKDVAQTIQLVMCRSCRNQLVKEYDQQGATRVFH